MPFSNLGLSDQLVQGILATGYTAPTEIQTQAIPLAIAGKDILGCAQTGTGKTAAFVLPILHHLLLPGVHNPHKHPRALVLTPTRELAQQVDEFVVNYGRFTPIRSVAIYGGVNMDNQIKRFQRGVDIVVATPGRLLDHINRRTVDLSHVAIFVLDEADRMFDMGFINDVKTIISKIPAKRQTLLFSATVSKEVRALVASIQHNPENIEVGEQRKPLESIRQHFYHVEQDMKLALLLHILKTENMESVLVFSRTKHGADKISRRLEKNGFKSAAIHANRTQAQRQRALAGFKQGQYNVMVATDIAARGIDVEGISHVVNFDTPAFAEDYIHRIGRTGRASLTGDALTFVSGAERKYLKSIEYFVGRTYEVKRYPGFDYTKRETPAAPQQQAEERKREHRPDRQHRPTARPLPRTKRPGGHQGPQRRQQGSNQRRRQPGGQQQGKAPQGSKKVSEQDWKKLIEEGRGEREGLRKRLKRFFTRS
ncbi:MAG TPA: DEAD/DEAH box helicase [Bacteroidota bacterium]|nr:DEAD/DEAH box helicase [Bacteroidota bacterium]